MNAGGSVRQPSEPRASVLSMGSWGRSSTRSASQAKQRPHINSIFASPSTNSLASVSESEVAHELSSATTSFTSAHAPKYPRLQEGVVGLAMMTFKELAGEFGQVVTKKIPMKSLLVNLDGKRTWGFRKSKTLDEELAMVIAVLEFEVCHVPVAKGLDVRLEELVQIGSLLN